LLLPHVQLRFCWYKANANLHRLGRVESRSEFRKNYAAAPKDEYYRQQGLAFLQTTLAAMLNLRSPEDSSLPGRSLDKLAARCAALRSADGALHERLTANRADCISH